MRLYNHDGIEVDVQDPAFFIDTEILLAQQQAIEEMLDYAQYI